MISLIDAIVRRHIFTKWKNQNVTTNEQKHIEFISDQQRTVGTMQIKVLYYTRIIPAAQLEWQQT